MMYTPYAYKYPGNNMYVNRCIAAQVKAITALIHIQYFDVDEMMNILNNHSNLRW